MQGEIARSELIAVDANGVEQPVRIVLHAPLPTPNGDWTCIIESDPLIGSPRGGIVGQDSTQALALALSFVRGRLQDFREGGGRIAFDDDARTDVPLDAQFGHTALRALPATYEDDYASCAETYATLRIFSDDLTPEAISAALGVDPTDSFRKGEPFSPRVQRPRPQHGWFLCTKGLVHSKDTRRHIDWLLDKVCPAALAFARVTKHGANSDVFSFWSSARGQGGPMLSVAQMQRLATLGLECIWDVYYRGDDEDDAG
jgi:Domain of unknown function (DUF4279)